MAVMDTRSPLEFLLTRRSVPVRMLSTPVPDEATMRQLLTAASRVPDHGKLVPFRFEVLRKPAIMRMARLTREIGSAQGRDPDKLEKQAGAFDDAPLTVAVICAPRTDSTIPLIEQEQTRGAGLPQPCERGRGGRLCRALADGGGWRAMRHSCARGSAIEAPEAVTGFVHIGTPKGPARPRARRPDVDALTRWVET